MMQFFDFWILRSTTRTWKNPKIERKEHLCIAVSCSIRTYPPRGGPDAAGTVTANLIYELCVMMMSVHEPSIRNGRCAHE